MNQQIVLDFDFEAPWDEERDWVKEIREKLCEFLDDTVVENPPKVRCNIAISPVMNT